MSLLRMLVKGFCSKCAWRRDVRAKNNRILFLYEVYRVLMRTINIIRYFCIARSWREYENKEGRMRGTVLWINNIVRYISIARNLCGTGDGWG